MEIANTIELLGSRLYQYDTDRHVRVSLKDASEIAKVQFANEGDIEAITMEHKQQEDGTVIAKIPNRLFVSGRNIVAYAVIKSENGERTRYDQPFSVKPRSKPPGYILPNDEDEILNYEDLEKRIEELEKGGTGGGGSGAPGADGYSPEAKVEETAEGAEITIIDKNGTTKATVKHGKDGKDGENGKDGKDGKDGADGKTAYQYAQDGGYTGTEEEFAQKIAEEIGGVEITSGEPTKQSTVLTVDPNAEEVILCTEEDFNELKKEINAKFDAIVNGNEVAY